MFRLGDDNSTPSNFSILAPGLNDEGRLAGLRFGLQNESARLNINALPILEKSSAGMMASVLTATDDAEESSDGATSDNIAVSLLLTLPGMTEDVADAILDWLDEDEEVRPFGAEAEYYSTLPTPIRAQKWTRFECRGVVARTGGYANAAVRRRCESQWSFGW